MVNQLLVTLVNSVLGTGKATARNNYAYHCPFCNHHKPKLEVNLTENKQGNTPWHCWACNKKGKTIYNLFKAIGVDISKLNEAKSLIKNSRHHNFPIKIDLVISNRKNANGLKYAKKFNIPFKYYSSLNR